MKNILLIAGLAFFSLYTHAGITIVSDLDETIKITNSGDPVSAALSAFKKNKIFTGMPEFFQGTTYADKVYILSASPTILRKKIKKALDSHGIKHDGIVLKKWLKFENRLKYKVRMIRELMDSSTDDFLLLGDDVGDDPEVYDEIKRAYPGRVIEAYIHVIKNRPVPATVVTHYASHDLAIREYAAGRMDSEVVEKVVNQMKNELDLRFVFPKFATCPNSNAPWAYQTATMFSELVKDLNRRLVSFCKSKK